MSTGDAVPNAASNDRTMAVLTQPDRLVAGKHACPVDGCGLSAEEHHALGDGTLELMRRLREAEGARPVAADPSDSEVMLDMVDRLVTRGYRVTVSIDMPGGNGLTMTGAPDDGHKGAAPPSADQEDESGADGGAGSNAATF